MKYTTLFNDRENFTNLKASFAHVGQDIHKYWKYFTVDDIWKQVVMYAIYGIEPYLRMEIKLKIHDEDQVNGSNLCKKIGPSYSWRDFHTLWNSWFFFSIMLHHNKRKYLIGGG